MITWAVIGDANSLSSKRWLQIVFTGRARPCEIEAPREEIHSYLRQAPENIPLQKVQWPGIMVHCRGPQLRRPEQSAVGFGAHPRGLPFALTLSRQMTCRTSRYSVLREACCNDLELCSVINFTNSIAVQMLFADDFIFQNLIALGWRLTARLSFR
jgi:hypothetical protein